LLACLLLVLPVHAYGPWEPEPEAQLEESIDHALLEEALKRFEESLTRAETSRAAHPDFLADLREILIMLEDSISKAATWSSPAWKPLVFTDELTDTYRVARHEIVLPANGDLILDVTTGDNLNLYNGVKLREKDGTTVLASFHHGSGSNQVHTVPKLRAGTYYLDLEKDTRTFYYGQYLVKVDLQSVSIPNDVEPNDSFGQAQTLALNSLVTGHLGFRGQLLPEDTEDWYRVTMPQAGTLVLHVTTSGLSSDIRPTDGDLNLYGGVYVYDANGTTQRYGSIHNPGVEREHKVSNLPAGTYFIRLAKDGRNFYWGSYTLRASIQK